MTVSTTPDTRYRRDDIAQVITSALAGHDFSHTAEWVRPPGCPCHKLAPGSDEMYCDMNRESCLGYVLDVAMPDGEGLTVSELISALPIPDAAGLVDAREAGQALASLASTRLANHPYRLQLLAKRLGDGFAEYEDAAPAAAQAAAASPGQLRCQYCTRPIPPERGPAARYCKNSHRVIAFKMRKREALRAANKTAAAGS